jgi:hypothetical protein
MQRRALILGSQTMGLTGVHNDVDAIRARLEARGFSLDVRIGDDASYEGICEGLERLVADSEPSDAALIYYSGHGARVVNPRRGQLRSDGRLEPELFHALVPTDWSATRFRGLLDLELSLHLARLTDKTHNVSIILDCCHSARMWKSIEDDDEPPVVRAVDRVEVPGVEDVVDELRKRDGSRLHGELNPHAVRLVACEADRSAYELRVTIAGRPQRMGLLTGTLVALLDELQDTRISWRTLAMLLREHVMQRIPIQRPEVEGAMQRYLFEVATAEQGGGVAYFLDKGKPALRTSRLLGAEVGARYAIMPLGASEYDKAATIAEAIITQIAETHSYVDLQLSDSNVAIPIGVMAFPVAALERRDRAATLRDLPDGGLQAQFELEWGVVVDGRPQPLAPGDTVHVGDRLYVGFENQDQKPLLFTVFDIGVDDAITLLTAASPMGTKVEPGAAYRLGLELGGEGMQVGWPDGVPTEHPLPESLIVIVSCEPHDFSALETGDASRSAPASYCVRRIDFVLAQPSGNG